MLQDLIYRDLFLELLVLFGTRGIDMCLPEEQQLGVMCGNENENKSSQLRWYKQVQTQRSWVSVTYVL